MKKLFLIIALISVASCSNSKDFKYGFLQIENINSKFHTTMETYPSNAQEIELMIGDFAELKKTKLDRDQDQFDIIVDYRIRNLEAEKFYTINGQEYGDYGTTKNGFGCTMRPLITESVGLRNNSALKGFEAAGLLSKFIAKYPGEAKFVNLSSKNVLFLNATFYAIYEAAMQDSSTINYFCPENETLLIYRQQFARYTNLSKEYINNLTYSNAVSIWKELGGIN